MQADLQKTASQTVYQQTFQGYRYKNGTGRLMWEQRLQNGLKEIFFLSGGKDKRTKITPEKKRIFNGFMNTEMKFQR